MKLPILILTFIVVSTTIHAQNPRITAGNPRTETYFYKNGGDSIRFAILGTNDTLQTTYVYRNGRPSAIHWKKDSAYAFDVLGRLTTKRYGLKEGYYDIDSLAHFFPNGRISSFQKRVEGNKTLKNYASDGRFLSTFTEKSMPAAYFSRLEDGNGVPIKVSRIDTLKGTEEIVTIRYDTTFYANGRPYLIKKMKDGRISLGSFCFNADGSLRESTPPDSLDLISFKDNVDCYYGLKNYRGDTVVKPRFDRIEHFKSFFWAAYTGESAILLDEKGAPMTPPTANMSAITKIMASFDSYHPDKKDTTTDPRAAYIRDNVFKTYFSFMVGEKWGIMAANGALVMPPQYLYINDCLENGQFFQGQDYQKHTLLRKQILTPQGKLIFPEKYKGVVTTRYKDYFLISEHPEINKNGYESLKAEIKLKNTINPPINEERIIFRAPDYFTFGLGKAENDVLLPTKFCRIVSVWGTPLFVASVLKTEGSTDKSYFKDGIFDVRTRRWLLDTSDYTIDNEFDNDYSVFIIEQLSTKKMGMMDTTGNYILPIAYDSIGIADVHQHLFWLKKGGKYQIFTVKNGKASIHANKYDFLTATTYNIWSNDEEDAVTYFIAKRNGKWGIIDASEKVIKPFAYDYAALNHAGNRDIILVKNNQAAFFNLTSLPNEADMSSFQIRRGDAKTEITNFKLVDNTDRVFFINDTGKVVIPPQYKPFSEDYDANFIKVEDQNKKTKLIFFESGAVIDYPFDYAVTGVDAKSRVMIVKNVDSLFNYGVVSMSGKLLVPCVNYAVTFGDVNASIFFVKKDTSLGYKNQGYILSAFDSDYRDSLCFDDNNWLMYDGDGKQMSAKPFRFPIYFKKGVGIGMQDAQFNLYKTDGSILAPFNKNSTTSVTINGWNNIRRDPKMGFYALFFNQGMTPSVILTKDDGEILIPQGRYDGISRFYGNYALVTAAGKVGLVDTLGKEVIAPQDLRTYTGQFMDSLNRVNVLYRQELEKKGGYPHDIAKQPIVFYESGKKSFHPDSLPLSAAQRASLWNLLLEKSLDRTIATASNMRIQRIPANINPNLWAREYYDENLDEYQPPLITVTDSTIAFALRLTHNTREDALPFYNFYRKNNRWEELKINDVLQIQGDKRWLINDLITKKVKALKDQQIDCSNASAFITTVENRFMLTKDGVDFCFESTGGGGDFVVISFTWAELKPFLKMRIF
jgi:hypothetical protein